MCILLEAAWHTTKLEARYRAQGNLVDAERAHERVLAAAMRSQDPYATLVTLEARLNRYYDAGGS